MRRFFKLVIVIVSSSLLLGGFIFFWVGDRPKVLRALYPVSAALSAPTLSCSQDAPEWLAKVSRYSLWGNSSLAGQLAYISVDGVIHECHHGWQGLPLGSELVDAQTRFRYASMTKLLTADLALRYMQVGGLMLDSQVLKILAFTSDHVDERLNRITTENLLRHSAGFDRLKSTDPMVVRNNQPWCPYNISPLAKVRLDFNPGERYAYHNINYCLLGMLLESVDSEGRSFRDLMEREYGLSERGIRFIDGPYLEDEVTYDFRNSGFYGQDYWKYFDFYALSSAMGLSGSAVALASLISSLQKDGEYLITQAPIEPICDETVKRGCYGYALFSYRPVGGTVRVHVQPGLLYGAPSLAIIDEHGGVTVWVGNGTRPTGSSTDAMLDHLYSALDNHYAAKPSR